jgi:hypothetical protein
MVSPKAVNIKITNPETIAKLELLNPDKDKSNPEFLLELLEAYEQLHGKNCSTTPLNHFKLQGEDKGEKEPVIREMFGLEKNDPLLMSECELLEKACEYSGKTIAEMSIEGRLLVAKNEIGRQVQYKLGTGKKGSADDRIAQTYNYMKQSGQKQSINRLTQMSGSNRKTVESWCNRNNITFE